ncbi:MAG: LD-carboxypeptidase [Chloracidobacterium sp.]|uniref:LD-carboxypeptidase n=1 Tax=Chloracidobacterium validum TaxID=2821543 RepID=A0ABX8BA06_9BACT|nr:LD-carboxypeptidase [Chloracidobacterium validum]QUW03774.1 LD-carboxypeptidase [Chloracidobacterium validum]
MVKPPALKPGDLIGVIAPASNVKLDWLAAGTRELERRGFRVIHRADIGAKARYTAGTLQRRLAEFHEIWMNPEVKAVIAARGGYGTMHLLPHLDAARLSAQPKIFVGYSDLTALHLFLWRACRLVTFHGPMVAKDFSAGTAHYDWDSFCRLTMDAQPAGTLTSPHVETLIGGHASGVLVGGCLSLVAALVGTPWQLDTAGTVLFLEDTATKPYQIDRLLQQLYLAGQLDRVAGFVFGEMSDCVQHAEQGYHLAEVIHDLIRPLGVPAIYGWRSGHSDVGNRTLPCGVRVTLDARAGTLTVTEAAVA